MGLSVFSPVFSISWLTFLMYLSIMYSDDEEVLQEESLEFDSGFGNIIVVDNLPVVPPEKFDKLEGVVRKIFGQIGVIKDDGLWMPVDPTTTKTLGYCFIEYGTPQVLSLLILMRNFIYRSHVDAC